MAIMLSNINVKYFLMAFALGLLGCYMFTPPPQVVVKFPSPHNAGKVMYRDGNDTCFMYRADRVSCPRDRKQIRDQPISENFITRNGSLRSMDLPPNTQNVGE